MTFAAENELKSEIDHIVDDLLSRWHSWRNGYTFARGFRGTDATCRDAQSQYHYRDRDSGAVDDYIETQVMHAVERAVDRIPNVPRQWHTVILIEARNLWAGNAVWSSFRLPEGLELEVLRIEARNRLIIELQREGCVGC